MQLTVKLPQEEVSKSKQKVINSAVKNVHIQGFRKGKAPVEVAQERLDMVKVNEAVLEEVLPAHLAQAIKDKKVEFLGNPEIKSVTTPDNADWEIGVELAEKPEVKLNDYKKAVKNANKSFKEELAKQKKTAKSTKEEKKADKPDEEAIKRQEESAQLNSIIEALLENCQVEVPQILINQDVNQQLSRLVQQINQMGLNVEDYLKAQNLTHDELRKRYEDEAEKSYQIELTLQAISDDLKIDISEKELEDEIKDIKNPEYQKQVQSSQENKNYFKSILARQKTIKTLREL